MRWLDRCEYVNDSLRRRRKFLWIPVRVGDVTRWLEWALVEEEAVRGGRAGGIIYWRVCNFC